MIYLLLAVIFSTLMLVIFKLIGIWRLNVEQAVNSNYLFAAVTGFIFMPAGTSFIDIIGKDWFGFAFFAGTMFMINFYVYAASSKKDGVAITAVSAKMSVIIPVIAGFLLFKDQISTIKITGIISGIFSFYLILKKDDIKVEKNPGFILFPLLLFLGTGINDTIVKYVQFNFLNGDESLFVDAVFSVSFVLSFIILLWRVVINKVKIDIKSIMIGLVLGAVNFSGAWNFLKSMSYFEASVLFPVVNVSVVTLSTLVGIVIFKEKLKKINIIGLLTAVLSIILISLG